MNKLINMVCDSSTLSNGLKQNGISHQNYKMYTSMERALAMMCSGHLYLSNGANWNDVSDRRLMEQNNVYAGCFSCSTRENIAMWMLYSSNHGKNGAMVNFYPAMIKELLDSDEIELGVFKQNGKFEVKKVLRKQKSEYVIYMTDVVYTDLCKGGSVRLSCGEDHINVDEKVIEDKDIFHKGYEWAYEKECRLVVRVQDDFRHEYPYVRLRLSQKSLNRLKEGRIVRSPVYSGGTDFGEVSRLFGEVNWNF